MLLLKFNKNKFSKITLHQRHFSINSLHHQYINGKILLNDELVCHILIILIMFCNFLNTIFAD